MPLFVDRADPCAIFRRVAPAAAARTLGRENCMIVGDIDIKAPPIREGLMASSLFAEDARRVNAAAMAGARL